MGVFASAANKYFKYNYFGQLVVGRIAGGVPSNSNVAEGWLKTKLGISQTEQLEKMVAEVMIERGVSLEEATSEVNSRQNLNGFKRMPGTGQLYIEGRQLKAAIKEAANIAMGAGNLKSRGWGTTNKGLTSWMAEHVFVKELELPLSYVEYFEDDGEVTNAVPVTGPSYIEQRFVHTHRGTGIQYEEVVTNAVVNFTVVSDYDWKPEDWAAIWSTGQYNGLGASRSQGFGTYTVTKWDLEF